MKIKIDGMAIVEIKNYSIGEKNLLVMCDAPIKGLESVKGAALQLCDEDDGSTVADLPIIKELVEVTYHFATQTAQEATLTAELEAAVAEKEAAIAESIREVLTLREELEAKDKALDDVLESMRTGLVKAPVDGEEWDSAKWYRQGDTVQYKGVMHECVKTCKGEEPALATEYWVAFKKSLVLEWSAIESGASIAVGDVVTHTGKTYRCIKAHTKSNIRIVTNTDFWESV